MWVFDYFLPEKNSQNNTMCVACLESINMANRTNRQK